MEFDIHFSIFPYQLNGMPSNNEHREFVSVSWAIIALYF